MPQDFISQRQQEVQHNRQVSGFIPAPARSLQTLTPRAKTTGGNVFGKLAPYSTSSTGGIGTDSRWTIYFPSMPEEIELSRSAEYKVIQVPQYPDGVHYYMHTNPMEIPLAFDLHGFDMQYCKDGPITLLRVAAILHSLTLPIRAATRKSGDPMGAWAGLTGSGGENKDDDSVQNLTGEQIQSSVFDNSDRTNYDTYTANSQKLGFAFPPPCYMELIHGAPYAIRCSGYIKNVSVKLRGPWIAANGADNLPTSAAYSFTFVHNPLYTNDVLGISGSDERWTFLDSAMAQDVAESLYDTQQRIRLTKNRVSTIGLS